MAHLYGAFDVRAQHGCLVVRDSESDGDVSDWNPADDPWFSDQGSAIFAVTPGVEGPVHCEVWHDEPDDLLPVRLFEDTFEMRGLLEVGDPAGAAGLEVPGLEGARQVAVFVDDLDWPARVQIVVR